MIYDTKCIFAKFTFIAFEATVHQILHTNCARNSLDLQKKKNQNIHLEGCLLWLELRKGFFSPWTVQGALKTPFGPSLGGPWGALERSWGH